MLFKSNGFVSEWPMVQPWKGCVGFPTESSNLSETTTTKTLKDMSKTPSLFKIFSVLLILQWF